ncbi:hypothetical protein LSCM1_02000 [Leishmania martiniquensis]|uniref:TRUD domain-containing protein n=1 Tax=Leishmania martiniquensis TaxID=1580590 RepID=A0A836KEB7_9TRYP|nr:hypothetical protein LSCM1_02000 [Leishmania martiniquensis]
MLRACGITSFLTPLPRLASTPALCAAEAWPSTEAADGVAACVRCATGNLKKSPEDFFVVEVDPAGQRTDAEDYNLLSAGASNLLAAVADDSVDDEAEEGALSRWEAELGLAPPTLHGPSKCPETCLHPMQALRGILTARAPELHRCFGTLEEAAARASSTLTQAALSLLLRDIPAAAKGDSETPLDGRPTASCGADTSLPWWRTAAHTLGHFPVKRDRQLVHLMVRWHFPHLRSWAGGTSAILCSLDLHYVLFCAALGEEAALCLARWSAEAHAARLGRSFDDETRAELHELFNSHGSEAGASSTAGARAAERGLCSTSFAPLAEAMRRQTAEDWATGAAAESVPLVSDKEVRRQVHELLRRFYPFVSCLVREGHVTLRSRARSGGSSMDSKDALMRDAAARPPSSTATGVGARRTRADMEAKPEDGPPMSAASVPNSATPAYVHVVVRKRNLDTAEMRQLLGEYFGVKDGSVCVAGMKDKRAVSVQRCSVPVATTSAARGRVHELLNAAPFHPVTLRWPADPLQSYAELLRVSASSVPVHLGQLSGNWFSLRVRGVRWASEADRKAWASPPRLTELESVPSSVACANAQQQQQLREFLQQRFARCLEVGFINYFGQQRFSETIERVDDHTGAHLFAARWVAAVRSLYRGCPDVYDAFPDKMEARFVPNKARDAQVMTHALRQTYRIYFAECPLSSADVLGESEVWTRLCEKAITEGVPFYLRSLWVHSGQSLFFNLAASYLVSRGMARATEVEKTPHQEDHGEWEQPSAQLSFEAVARAQLPLGGYHVGRVALDSTHRGEAALDVLWLQWRNAAVRYALRELRWTSEQGFGQRRVAGVPVPGSWRAVVARPTDASLEWERGVGAEAQQCACRGHGVDAEHRSTIQLSFALPSSCYATIFLREVLGCDKWW